MASSLVPHFVCLSAIMNYISTLPLELLKHIAAELPVLRDVISFSLVSSIFHAAVNSDQIVYQALFLKTYEPPAEPVGYDWKTKFRLRQAEDLSDETITEMIYDARPSRRSSTSVATSANIEALSLKFANPKDIPRSLDTLLYPLRAIQYVGDETWIVRPATPAHSMHIQQLVTERNALRNFRDKSADIGLLVCTALKGRINTVRTYTGLLEPYMFPNFWEGKVIPNASIPTRWVGMYVQPGANLMPCELNLVFSNKSSFTAEGRDIMPYTIRQGTVGKTEADGRRTIKWKKLYDTFAWDYEGTLDYGGQRMTGVWGIRRASDGEWNQFEGAFGIFGYWAIPEDAPDILS